MAEFELASRLLAAADARIGAVAGLDLRFSCGRACLDAAFVSFMPR
jgi:hypothetical protein